MPHALLAVLERPGEVRARSVRSSPIRSERVGIDPVRGVPGSCPGNLGPPLSRSARGANRVIIEGLRDPTQSSMPDTYYQREPAGAHRPRAVVSWSSGKDSAFALGEVIRSEELNVVGLLTTITKDFGRVSIHGVREELLDRQATELRLPLRKVEIPYPCPNSLYEEAMGRAVRSMVDDGITRVVFGDLFLEDVRAYREDRLASSGILPVFPLWHRSTADLARHMIESGLEARVVCLDPKKLPRRFAGRAFDESLLADLPAGVDPCGENGEFHTFVTDGPGFAHPISVVAGPVVERDGFVFADFQPD